MEQATIRFEGNGFPWVKWTDFLRQTGFKIAPHSCREQAIYASRGSRIVLENYGFIRREGQQGYEWRAILKHTRRWEGTIKFFGVLLAAYTMPQRVVVTLSGREFADRETLRTHAEATITRDFSLEELTDHGVYRWGDGFQFA